MQDSPQPIRKRKKSVHFPENHVIPIDDSSYENSSDESQEQQKHNFGYGGPIHVADNSSDSSDTYIINKQDVAKKNKTPQKFLLSTKSKRKAGGEVKESEEQTNKGDKAVPKWKAEREAFIMAMRVGK